MSNDGRNHLISVVNALGETYTTITTMPTIGPNRSIRQEREFSTPTMCGGSRCPQLPWRGSAGNLPLYSKGKSCRKDQPSALESYYKNGSRKATSTDRGTQEYSYDAAGRVIKLSYKDTNGRETEFYSYVYDANGNLIEEDSRCGETRYTYDALDRLISVTEPEGKVTTYTYDASGNRNRRSDQ